MNKFKEYEPECSEAQKTKRSSCEDEGAADSK